MNHLLDMLQELSLKGYGVTYHPVHKRFWPFNVDDEVITFWHDPDGCDSKSFETAISKIYEQVKRNG